MEVKKELILIEEVFQHRKTNLGKFKDRSVRRKQTNRMEKKVNIGLF